MNAIEHVAAWEAFDSRGNPTVACSVQLRCGARGRAIVPAGASTGNFDARVLCDGGDRYAGRGVREAVAHVQHTLGPGVVAMDADDQPSVDAALRAIDGTDDLSRLGANAVLAVSIATARAAAAAHGIDLYQWLGDGEVPVLPLPMVNILSGGAHAGRAMDIQDVLVVPLSATSFTTAIECAWNVRRAVSDIAAARGLSTALVADEGGLGLCVPNVVGLELVTAGIERAGYHPGYDVGIAVDIAANQLRVPDGYNLATEDRTLDAAAWSAELAGWCNDFAVVSVEDPMADDDWDGWGLVSAALRDRVQIVGDDLFATRADRLARAVDASIANAVLVKPNQNGTLSGASEVVCAARRAGFAAVVSARSGDTEEEWLADLAVGWSAGQIKVGSTQRSERTAKWNRLLQIEAESNRAVFAGATALGPLLELR